MVIWRSLKPASILACLSFMALRGDGDSADGTQSRAEERRHESALQRSRIQEATDEIQSRL